MTALGAGDHEVLLQPARDPMHRAQHLFQQRAAHGDIGELRFT